MLRLMLEWWVVPKQFHMEEVFLKGKDKEVAEREDWERREKRERERGRGVLLIYMENDVTQVKVGGEPS